MISAGPVFLRTGPELIGPVFREGIQSDDVSVLFVFILVVIPDQDWMYEEVPNPVWLGVRSEVELL